MADDRFITILKKLAVAAVAAIKRNRISGQ